MNPRAARSQVFHHQQFFLTEPEKIVDDEKLASAQREDSKMREVITINARRLIQAGIQRVEK